MSDSPAEFAAKTKAMLEKAVDDLEKIGKLFSCKLIWHVIRNTPGPNNQLGETEYVATGRLRGGWYLDSSPISMAGRWEGGPYDRDGYGEMVFEPIQHTIMSEAVVAERYLNNDVAYNNIVHWGGGRMPYPRDYVDQATLEAENLAVEARLEAMG